MFFKTYSTGMKEEMQGQPSHESIHSNMREKKLKKIHYMITKLPKMPLGNVREHKMK
jgi:hypothetical protein